MIHIWCFQTLLIDWLLKGGPCAGDVNGARDNWRTASPSESACLFAWRARKFDMSLPSSPVNGSLAGTPTRKPAAEPRKPRHPQLPLAGKALLKAANDSDPATKWTKKLRNMPQQRLIQLREGRYCELAKRAVNIEAVMLQAVGENQKPPCKSCTNEAGPFTVCVSIPGVCKNTCANCHYGSEGTRCTLREAYGENGIKKEISVKEKKFKAEKSPGRKRPAPPSEDSSDVEILPPKKGRKSAKTAKSLPSTTEDIYKSIRDIRKNLRQALDDLEDLEAKLDE
ncbi:hypothetical protein GQ44DRAFT_771775 [Phaeosphaeriaceae sp. PMI808]|nr:hypothetical protein GQ44DRAFT_771775 [Phaeosphaeriaceae sp. PMI808]